MEEGVPAEGSSGEAQSDSSPSSVTESVATEEAGENTTVETKEEIKTVETVTVTTVAEVAPESSLTINQVSTDEGGEPEPSLSPSSTQIEEVKPQVTEKDNEQVEASNDVASDKSQSIVDTESAADEEGAERSTSSTVVPSDTEGEEAAGVPRREQQGYDGDVSGKNDDHGTSNAIDEIMAEVRNTEEGNGPESVAERREADEKEDTSHLRFEPMDTTSAGDQMDTEGIAVADEDRESKSQEEEEEGEEDAEESDDGDEDGEQFPTFSQVSAPQIPSNPTVDQLLKMLQEVCASKAADSIHWERRFSSLERKFVDCKEDLSRLKWKNEELKLENEQAVQDKQRNSAELTSLRKSSTTQRSMVLQLERQVEELENKYRGAQMAVEAKGRDVDKLLDDVSTSERLRVEVQRSKAQLEVEISHLRSELSTHEMTKSRFEQEKKELKTHKEWLESQLDEKVEELLEVRRETLTEINDLKQELEDVKRKYEDLEVSSKLAKQQVQEMEVLMKEKSDEVEESRNQQTILEEQHNRERQTWDRLEDHYKAALQEEEKKVDELHGVVQALRDTVVEKDKAVGELKQKIAELEENGNHLNKENDLLKEKVSKSPRLVVAGEGAAHSDNLMAMLLNFQAKYEEVNKELQVQKDENRRLTTYMNKILTELEEKAPQLRKQKQERDWLEKENVRLVACYEKSMTEQQRLKNLSQRAKAERQEVVQMKEDLSRQVQTLLQENYNLRKQLGVPAQVPTVTVMRSSRGGNENDHSSDLISEEMITFRNISDLQQKNMMLLAKIRQVGTEKSQIQKQEHDKRLTLAMETLDNLRAQQVQHKEKFVELVKQRDMYKSLYDQVTNTNGKGKSANLSSMSDGQSSASSSSSSSSSFSSSSNPMSMDLSSGQELYQTLKQEFEDYKVETAKNRSIAMAELDAARQECSEGRINLAKTENKLESLTERFNRLLNQHNSEAKEMETLRARNGEMHSMLAQHQQLAQQAETKLNLAQEEKRRVEQKLSVTHAEVQVLKEREERLIAENGRLLGDKKDLQKLLEDIQTNDAARQATAEDVRRRLEGDLKKMESIVDQYKDQLTDERKNTATERENYQIQMNHLQMKMAEKSEEIQQLKEAAIRAKVTQQSLEDQLQNMKDRFESADKRVNVLLARLAQSNLEEECSTVSSSTGASSTTTTTPPSSSAASNTGSQVDLGQMAEMELEVQSLREQLSQERQTLVDYKAILAASELAQSDLKEHLERVQKEAEQDRELAENQRKTLESTVASLQQQLEVVQSSGQSLRQLESDLQARLTALEEDRKKIEAALEDSEREKKELLADAKLYGEQYREAQSRYENECILRLSDIKSLNEVKKENEQLSLRVEKLSSAERLLKEENESQAQSLREMSERLQKEVEEAKVREKDLQDQNSLLHKQLEVRFVRFADEDESDAATPSSSSPGSSAAATTLAPEEATEAHSAVELMAIIRFLRRQKEMISCKQELLEAEVVRLRQQVLHNMKVSEDLRTKLREEQQRLQDNLQTEAAHAKVMEQLQMMNLLRESNVQLRQQNEELSQQVESLSSKAKGLEEQLQPLKEEKKDLESKIVILTQEKAAAHNASVKWQERNQQLLDKYDTIDPEEYKKMTAAHSTLQGEYNVLKGEYEKAKVEIAEVNKKAELATQQLQVMQSQVNALRKNYNDSQKLLVAERNSVAELKKELEVAKSSGASSVALGNLKKQVEDAQKVMASRSAELQEMDKAKTAAETLAKELKAKLQRAIAMIRDLKAKGNGGGGAGGDAVQKSKESADSTPSPIQLSGNLQLSGGTVATAGGAASANSNSSTPVAPATPSMSSTTGLETTSTKNPQQGTPSAAGVHNAADSATASESTTQEDATSSTAPVIASNTATTATPESRKRPLSAVTQESGIDSQEPAMKKRFVPPANASAQVQPNQTTAAVSASGTAGATNSGAGGNVVKPTPIVFNASSTPTQSTPSTAGTGGTSATASVVKKAESDDMDTADPVALREMLLQNLSAKKQPGGAGAATTSPAQTTPSKTSDTPMTEASESETEKKPLSKEEVEQKVAANFIVVAPLTEECTRTGLVWSGKEDEAASKKRKLAALEGPLTPAPATNNSSASTTTSAPPSTAATGAAAPAAKRGKPTTPVRSRGGRGRGRGRGVMRGGSRGTGGRGGSASSGGTS